MAINEHAQEASLRARRKETARIPIWLPCSQLSGCKQGEDEAGGSFGGLTQLRVLLGGLGGSDPQAERRDVAMVSKIGQEAA